LHLSVGFPAVLVFDLSVLEQPYLGRGAEVGDESGARGRPLVRLRSSSALARDSNWLCGK
jgi:hypothetical protein